MRRMIPALLLLVAASVGQAQAQQKGKAKDENRVLDAATIERLIPLLEAEAKSAAALSEQLGRAGVSQAEYVAMKNAVMIARVDHGEARLDTLRPGDATRAARSKNVSIYREHAERLNEALRSVAIDPGCTHCRAAPFIPGGRH